MDPESPTPKGPKDPKGSKDSKDPRSSREKREEQRKKQRESLGRSIGDPLMRFTVPDVVRKHSGELNLTAEKLQERVRSVSAASQESLEGKKEDHARQYVQSREDLADDAFKCIKKGKQVVDDLRRQGVLDGPTAKRARDELDDCEMDILQERAAQAANRVKLRYGILSHTTHARIGEAYLAAVVESLPEPPGARLKKQGPRAIFDQSSFRQRLIQTYNPPEWNHDPDNPEGWCPVSKQMWQLEDVTAAHIVPYAVGEVNAAYLFGLDPEESYEAIWSVKNGLLLHKKIEKALDDAKVVIIPDEQDQNELKLVVLNDTLLNVKVGIGGSTFREFHNRRLEFKTEARPGHRNLYLHYLLALFRRKRFDVEGWEQDFQRAHNSYIWGTPGPWLRRSIVKALALEIGDSDRLDEFVVSDAGLADFPQPHSAKQETGIAARIKQALLRPVKEDDEFEQDTEIL